MKMNEIKGIKIDKYEIGYIYIQRIMISYSFSEIRKDDD